MLDIEAVGLRRIHILLFFTVGRGGVEGVRKGRCGGGW